MAESTDAMVRRDLCGPIGCQKVSPVLKSPSMATTATDWDQLILSMNSNFQGLRQGNGNPRVSLTLDPCQRQRGRAKSTVRWIKRFPWHRSLDVPTLWEISSPPGPVKVSLGGARKVSDDRELWPPRQHSNMLKD